MSKSINTKVDSGKTLFTFTDRNGETVARFNLYPLDIAAAARLREAAVFLKENGSAASGDEIGKLNAEIERQICYALGCDTAAVFGKVSALAVMSDGRFFADVVLTTVGKAIQSAAESRKKSLDAAKKYLEAYV